MPYLFFVGDDVPIREITTEQELYLYADMNQISPEDLEIRADLLNEGGIQEVISRFAPATALYQMRVDYLGRVFGIPKEFLEEEKT
jgi:hypothetical protein